jgi:flagellar hook-length control protein FliK
MQNMIRNNAMLLPITTTSNCSTPRDGVSQSKQNTNFGNMLSRSVQASKTSSSSSQAVSNSAGAQTANQAQANGVVNAAPEATTTPPAVEVSANPVAAQAANQAQANDVVNAAPKPKATTTLPAVELPANLVAAQAANQAQANDVVNAASKAAAATPSAVELPANSATTQGTLLDNLATDEPDVKMGQTKDIINSVVNPYGLLMMMLQANTLSTAATAVNKPAQTDLPSATVSNNLQVGGESASEISAQTSLLQLLNQAKLSVVPTQAAVDVVKNALSALTNGNLTNAQLLQARTQLATLFPGKPLESPATEVLAGKQLVSVSPLLGSAIIDSPALEIGASQSQSDGVNTSNPLDSKQQSNSLSLTKLTASFAQTGKDLALPSQPQVSIITDNQLQTASIIANPLQTSDPLLTALQAQVSGKLTRNSQMSIRSLKSELEISPIADEHSSVPAAINELSTGEKFPVITSAQEKQSDFQFDGNQFLQSPSNGQMSHFSDPTGGTFSQILNNQQSQSSVINTTATVSQGTASKDSLPVMQQIVDQAKLITRVQNTEMVIKLKPEHLGELTLKITVEQGLVNATFHSNNSEVRASIEASLPQLKQDLVNSGLKIDNVGVYTGLDQFTSNQQQNSPQHSQQPQLKFSRQEAADSFDDAAQFVAESQVVSADGVDYRI